MNSWYPTLEEVTNTLETVHRITRRTPLESSRFLAEVLGAERVFMKCENLQRTGAYKIRGAYNRLSKLSAAEKALGVVAASAGNHAQGVAFAARDLGIKATIFMPEWVALPKFQATNNYGANVVLHGSDVEESLAAAQKFAAETGAIFIPPFDNKDVISGQGTIALEMLELQPDLDTLIVPVGGGGLISGIAATAKQLAAKNGREIKIIGVQAKNSAAYLRALEAGEPVTIKTKPTIADGIAVARAGDLNFDIVRDFVDEVVTVTDDDIARAILMLLERAKLVVEPAGAASVAAILAGKIKAEGKVGLVLSGGNIDPILLQRVIGHGLAAAARYQKLRIKLRDKPGELVNTARIVAAQNANVIEVLHTRHGTGLPVSDVELELHIETRGEEHGREVVEALRADGYEVRVGERY